MELTTLYQLFLNSTGIVTDSRTIQPGCIFFALKGDNFDGNTFAPAAIEAGASHAVVSDPGLQGEKFILVEDTLLTLQQLALHHRKQFNCPFIGITGSNGKTTTKELLNLVLSSRYRVGATKGNFNNHIGLPLTLLSFGTDLELGILEMGANHKGEIRELCKIGRPTHGLVTNIGKAHLEGFGGLEGVKRAKSELYQYLAENGGVAFVNKEENFLEELSGEVGERVFYGTHKLRKHQQMDCIGTVVSEFPATIEFTDRKRQFYNLETRLSGKHSIANLMAAVAVGQYFEIPGEDICASLAGYTPGNNRAEVINTGTNTFLLDAYNANPSSMRSSIESFSQMEGERKLAILGGMKELGEYSDREHAELVDFIRSIFSSDILTLVLVGSEFAKYKARADFWFASYDEVSNWFHTQNMKNTVVLIKGSRAYKLEQLLEGVRPSEPA